MKQAILLPVLAMALLLPEANAQTTVLADFSGGNGTTSADQYTGTAGGGWSAGWNRRIGTGSTTVIEVKEDTPFSTDSGNYLQINYTRTETTTAGSNRTGVNRPFAHEGEGAIDTTKAYSISFQFRLDTLTGWGQSVDQIAFSSESRDTIGGMTASYTLWGLMLRGDNGWNIFNGNGNGSTPSYLTLSGDGLAAPTVGVIYTVQVEIDPLLMKYDLVISYGGESFRASEFNNGNLFGFGDNSHAASSTHLQFRSYSTNQGDVINMSLDNIQVMQAIPEPGGVALMLGGVLLMAVRKLQ